jgi:phage gp29-like protein
MRQPKKNTAVKKGNKNAPIKIINQQIDVRPFTRREQDVPNWRAALQNAESRVPRRNLLYDLYADVVLDAHVTAVWGKRIDAVTGANWQFVDNDGQPIDEINQLIDSIGFDELLDELLNSKTWGYTILEPEFYKNSNGKWEVNPNLIPRLNYRPHKGIVAYQATGDEGINIREGIYAKTVMEVGRPTDLGLLLKAALYYVLKRGSLGDYAMFVQVFGNPIIDATWDGFDEKQRQQLLTAISELGSGGALVRPDGTSISLIENKTAGNEPHPNFINLLNREISKCLLGTTETTESSNSSGYAQSKTHGEQDDKKHETDLTFIRRCLNSHFIKVLEAHGFNTANGYFMIQGEETELNKTESYAIQKSLVTDLGLPVDDDFFYETYGIPKPDNYETLKKEGELKKDGPAKQGMLNDKKPKQKEDVKLSFKSFFKKVKKVF